MKRITCSKSVALSVVVLSCFWEGYETFPTQKVCSFLPVTYPTGLYLTTPWQVRSGTSHLQRPSSTHCVTSSVTSSSPFRHKIVPPEPKNCSATLQKRLVTFASACGCYQTTTGLLSTVEARKNNNCHFVLNVPDIVDFDSMLVKCTLKKRKSVKPLKSAIL